MIIDLLHTPVVYSEFSPVSNRGVKAQRINCTGKGTRMGDNLLISIISTYNLDDFSTGTTHEVLRSETKYEVITDGTLNVEELYEVYEHSMVYLLRRLYNMELANRIQPAKDLHPLPPADLFEEMQSIVDEFNMGTFRRNNM